MCYALAAMPCRWTDILGRFVSSFKFLQCPGQPLGIQCSADEMMDVESDFSSAESITPLGPHVNPSLTPFPIKGWMVAGIR
jgi:hypothetical protein